jgi:hypothetical protein
MKNSLSRFSTALFKLLAGAAGAWGVAAGGFDREGGLAFREVELELATAG